jgi:hypothetical protein
MIGLTREERGTYITLLTLIYERGGSDPGRRVMDRGAALVLNVRAWRKDRASADREGQALRP